jgi:nicotinate-nucleotide adenylyltransferase
LRLLVFGGSFNPVHIGHLVVADELRDEFGYDLVLLVPSFNPPHKELGDDPGADRRLAMLALALEEDPRIAIDDCELKRGGISYTVDTLADIGSRYSIEGKPGLVLGDDLVPGFPSWRDPAAIARAADIVCARRSSEEELPLGFPHRYAHNSIVRISSNMVRQRIAAGKPFRRLLPSAVYRYIAENGLYGLRKAQL